MYSYIKGTVEEIYLDRIVLENNGIGYEINVSSFTAQSVQKGKDAKIFTKLIVREDDMSLCGFASRKEVQKLGLGYYLVQHHHNLVHIYLVKILQNYQNAQVLGKKQRRE